MIAIGEYTISTLNDLDYYEVTSSDSMVVIEDENFTPEAVTFTSKHRLGNGNLEAYSGRFKIETSKDGETWETKYTSSGNESSVEYELPSALEDKVPYLFRKSVGGDRAIEEIVGGSVVWNQLVQNGDFSDGANGWKIYDATKGSLSVSNGVATLTYTTAGEGGYAYGLQLRNSPLTSTTGHKYLALSKVKSDFTGQIRYEVGNNVVSAITLVSGQWVECPCICEKVSTGTGFIVKPVLANIVNGSTLQIKNVQLFDLTTMFGTQIAGCIYSLEQSTAGAGVAKLKEWGFFTEDYYEYCEPTLKSVEGLLRKKTVGFNQWDEEWEVGIYNSNTGKKYANNNAIRTKNKVKVLPNTTYYAKVPSQIYKFYYDADENYISGGGSSSQNATFTTPSNAYYMNFYVASIYGTTYNHDICINLSDPTRNGQYEPYESHSYSLDSTLTLRGIPKLDSNNNLYFDGDIYPADGQGKRRYGLVTFDGSDDESWSYYTISSSDNANNLFRITIPTRKSGSLVTGGCELLALGYVTASNSSTGRTHLTVSGANTAVDFVNKDYSSVADWKAYLAQNPITVLYELAEPTTFTALPYHNPQELSEYGTEEFVTTGIIPVGHNTKYPANIKNIRCSLYKPNETPSTTTLLDQITVPIVSGLQYQPFVQRTVFEWALSSSSTELDENTTWAEQKPKPTQAQPYLWERSRNDYSNGTHTYSDAHCDVTISGVISDVDQVKGQITNKIWQSDITTSINSYDNTTVSTIRDRVSTTEQNLTGITTRVGAVESTTGSLGTRMTAAESSISQNADNIELKVSKDGVISSINQSPESITISADKVNIAGSTAFTSLNSQVTAIQNETNQKSELIRGTQTAATYSWTGTSTTISQLTDGMEIRYWLPFSVGGGTVSGSYSYYDGSKTTTGTNTGVGLTLTLKDGTMTEEIPVYYGSMSRLTSHYGYGNIIRMVYRENVRVNNGNSTYYTVAKGFWCDANYDTNSNYVQYSTAVTSGANNGVYQYSLIMRDSANTWVSIVTTNGAETSKSAYTGGLYYDKILYHSSSSNYASNKTTSTVYDSIGFDLRYSTNCGTTLTTRKPVYLVGTINNTDKRFYLDTTQWWTQTVPTSADGKTYIYIGEAYSSYQVWLATENKAYQYYNGRFITLEEIKDLEAMSWINSTGQNAADIIANWATDATSATTTINGGLIQTHTIQASHLATNAIMSNNYQASQNANSPYSVTGSFLDLDNGNFYTPNFGLDNVNGNAYFNGEITATSGQIGDDTSNHWQIGTVVDFNGNQSAAIESNGTSYIQSGDWMISNNRIDTRHYDNQRKYTYLYEDGVYWDFGLHTPSLTSDNDYDNNFIYIRNHESTIPTLEGAWNYVFRVDRNGMIYINGVSLDDKYASIDGVDGAYLPLTGGSLSGNLSVGGNLSVTGTVTGLKNLSINGKTYNGSTAVNVGTIGAAYGGTGQTSLINSANALINALDTGSSTPVDNDYYISQYVNGGTTTKTYHRRPMSALWLYIKGKINADTDLYIDKFVPKTGGEFTGAVTVSDALIADEITSGNLIVNGVGRFTNGIYGDLTGNASTATLAAKVADSGNGQATTFGYSKSGLTTTSDIAVWDGYELRKITPANLKTSLSLAKGDVGLGNVENKSSATIRGELTSSNVTTALGYTPYNGATNPNGYVSSSGVTSITLKAGTGISLDVDNTAITSTGTRTITNTGVRSISEGTTNGTISVNTGGTTADVVVHGLQALAYKASLGASDVGLGNVTNNKQVKGLSSGTTSGHLVTWGSDGYTVADSGIAKGSVTTKITLSGTDHSASSNTITITKANLQSAVQDTSLVLMTAAERSKLSSIQVSEGGTIDFSGVTASAPITATVNETTKAVNITHNTSGVTAGTYRSVTVNTYGHVTAGTNPTTLSGYGITDAKIANGVITLGSNTITPLTASSTLDATKLSGTASIDTTGNAATADSATSATTATTANSATKATQDGDGNTISSTYLKLSGGTVTGITKFDKTIRDASGQHYFGGAANRSQWYKITLAHNGVTPPSSQQWYMCSMTLHVAGDYNYYPKGSIELSYYIYWNGTTYLTDKVFATGYGPNINKAKVYYNLTNPFEIYVDTSGAYTTLWVDYVSYRDSAQSHNTKETKVETASAITVADYLQVPMSSIYTYDGSSLFIDSAHLLPSVTNTDNLGSSTYKWANVYATTFNGDLSGNATSANTASKLSHTPNNTTTFLRGDNTWSSVLTGSLTIAKAGECGVEVTNSQATNPNQVAFIVGTNGNGGIYSRKHSKWIVCSDASGNVVLSGNANTATSATKATQDGDGNTISSTYLKLSGGTMTGTEKFNSNFMSLNFRADNTSYTTGLFYGTNGNEALALATKNAVTSFMVVHGSDPTTWNTSTWTSASPTLQTKNNSLYVHELIPSGTTPTYNFKVNGTSYLGGNVRISDTNADTASCEMQYNRDLQCLEFIFN